MCESIRNLKSVLLPKFLNSDKEISNVDIKYLTAPGENYGSILLAIDITLKETLNGKTETIQCVAKTVTKNDFIKNFFMFAVTFKKELSFYNTVIPALREFQIDQGMKDIINFTADFFGGRLSLDDKLLNADEDAVILLENLKVKKYKSVDRMVGYDFDTICLIIKDLALLHAVPIALKIKRPDIFKAQILPSLEYANVFQSLSEEMKNSSIEDIINIAQENRVPYLPAIRKKCENCWAILNRPTKAKEPFATVTHNDMWINNTMLQFDENGKPISNKIIDFQFPTYDSPGKDIIFLIFDNVQNEVIKNHYDTIIRIYFDTFLSTLQQLKVDVEEFSFKNFLQELDHAASSTFVICQCLMMLRVIFAKKEAVNDVENLSSENILPNKAPSQQHKEKLYLLIEEFVKRRWI